MEAPGLGPGISVGDAANNPEPAPSEYVRCGALTPCTVATDLRASRLRPAKIVLLFRNEVSGDALRAVVAEARRIVEDSP